MRVLHVALALLPAVASTALAVPADEAGEEFFERKVRPLLAEKCFSCHGRGQKKGKLSLDSRAGVMAGGENGIVAVAGKPEESPLVKAVTYAGDVQMPPDEKLSDQEIAALKQWVSLGLPWPAKDAAGAAEIRTDGAITEQDRAFWSFQAVRDPAPPAVQRTDWPRSSIDHFILARLEAEGLQPSGEADRRALIRRATFDLHGLPPSAEEVEAFATDEQPLAYERLIDRLLASPRYGERWARHWLDIARYGEDQAHTFAARAYPQGYRYREWVINSLNDDLPYDQFLIDQIAGDLLPEGDRTARLPALGYFALGPVYYADAGCAPKAKADEYDDRIDTLTRGMLGLTVSCARCHDHKFDPISARDYYALAGVFASTEYLEAPLVPADVVKIYDDAQAKIKQAEERLKAAQTEEQRLLGESFAPLTTQYLLAAWRVQNRRKVESGYKVASAIEGTELKDFLVERWLQYLNNEQAKKNPTFAPWFELVKGQDAKTDLSADAAAVAAMEPVAQAIQQLLVEAIGKRSQLEATYREQLAAVKEGEKKPEKPKLEKPVEELLKELVDRDNTPFAIPKDRLEKLLPEDRRQTLVGLQKEVNDCKQASPPKYPVAHSLTEGKMTNQKIHLRGNVKELGDEVPRRFLNILSSAEAAPFAQGSGRLELARAIASPANPLTARVIVNRVWQQHFGRGIVDTPSNFGLLGQRPTHPELLDHLAMRFVASGWSLKELHRVIMNSSVYRQGSGSGSGRAEGKGQRAEGEDKDPDNRLLWRMNRRRLDVESWRDALLAASGELSSSIGGPSLDLNDGNNRRRTLYAAVSRHDLNPMLRLFDFPDPNLTSERRAATTVPMQQLFVLNSEFMIRQARGLAASVERENLPDDDARIAQLYRLALGRAPSEAERALGRQFLSRTLPEGTSAANVKLTRWQQYAQALLGTNEFVFVD